MIQKPLIAKQQGWKEHRGQVFILDKRLLYCSKEEGGEPPRLNKCKRDLRG